MTYFRVPRVRMLLCRRGHFDLSEGIKYVIPDRHASLSFIDDAKYQTPIVVDFKYGGSEEMGKRGIIKISVTSVLGKQYELDLMPNIKGELKALPPLEEGGVSKQYKSGEWIESQRKKDFEIMRKNTELILKSKRFKILLGLIAEEEIKRENFTRDMQLYLGIADKEMRNIKEVFSKK